MFSEFEFDGSVIGNIGTYVITWLDIESPIGTLDPAPPAFSISALADSVVKQRARQINPVNRMNLFIPDLLQA